MSESAWPVAMPVGHRSCGRGGYWHSVLDADGAQVLDAALARLKIGCNPLQYKFVRQELKARMRSAINGELELATRDERLDVRATRRHPEVLELHSFSGAFIEDQRRWVRLYFTEPAMRERQMLALALEWKVDEPEGANEQDQHIDLAYERGVRDLTET